jgi:hypothetical protein
MGTRRVLGGDQADVHQARVHAWRVAAARVAEARGTVRVIVTEPSDEDLEAMAVECRRRLQALAGASGALVEAQPDVVAPPSPAA